MTMKLSRENRERLIQSIRRYSEENWDDPIGELQSSLFLDFCFQEMAPLIYNQAISDAQSYLQNRLLDMESDCYLPEMDDRRK